jgi:hypothetical protein
VLRVIYGRLVSLSIIPDKAKDFTELARASAGPVNFSDNTHIDFGGSRLFLKSFATNLDYCLAGFDIETFFTFF